MQVKLPTTRCFRWPPTHPPSTSWQLRRSGVLASYILSHVGGSIFRRQASPSRRLKRCCSGSSDALPDELSKKILEFQFSDISGHGYAKEEDQLTNDEEQPSCDELWRTPDWHRRGWFDVAIERSANNAGLPLSLRMIKRKIQWQEGLLHAGESACCSVKKAFSSLVFIIRELHSYSLYLREALSATGDIQAILTRVQREIHVSFVWLFQRVFSHTPTLMVSVMILLANFTVHSMAANVALANPIPEVVSFSSEMESSSMKASFFPPSSSFGMSTFVGGGGGGKCTPVSTGMEGEGFHKVTTLVPDGGGTVPDEKERRLWGSIVKEAREMETQIDPEAVKRLVSPVIARIEPDDLTDYQETAMTYQVELLKDPDNGLLLGNYAQFLYLVFQQYNRAEEFFERAIEMEPRDPELYSKYASFLWKVRKDLRKAEKTLLGAIAAEPGNSFYAANYADFLWKTGGEGSLI